MKLVFGSIIVCFIILGALACVGMISYSFYQLFDGGWHAIEYKIESLFSVLYLIATYTALISLFDWDRKKYNFLYCWLYEI